jgi:ATP-dependent Lhr-like helicase
LRCHPPAAGWRGCRARLVATGGGADRGDARRIPLAGRDDASILVASGGEVAWWTFAGGRANAALAHRLAGDPDMQVTSDNFSVRFPSHQGLDVVEAGLRGLRGSDPACIQPPVSEQTLDGLKFAECLPADLAAGVVRSRLSDGVGVGEVLGRSTRSVIAS